MGEFDLIRKYFARSAPRARLGIGDDCALLAPRAGWELAISTDMLVEGTHFFAGVDPYALGWKTLAVNLSDLAAMGAQPWAFTLALALPYVDEPWLAALSEGLFACGARYQCELIGGDTTRGPLNLCVTVIGEVPQGAAVRRDGAQAEQDIWVSGRLGDAALALRLLQNLVTVQACDRTPLVAALERPEPQVDLGVALRHLATAMIDISDGLVADLGHLLEMSNVGATIDIDALPISPVLARQAPEVRLQCALAGGDDYQLCFMAPVVKRSLVLALAPHASHLARIGVTDAQPGLRLVDRDGMPVRLLNDVVLKGFDHFA